MHTEMKYRFLIHYTLSFIGGYLGLYAIVSRADLFGNARQPIFLVLCGIS